MNCERAIDHVIDSPEAFASAMERTKRILTPRQMRDLCDGKGLPFDAADGEGGVLTPVPSHGKPLYSCPFRNEPDACCRINREKQNRKDKQ